MQVEFTVWLMPQEHTYRRLKTAIVAVEIELVGNSNQVKYLQLLDANVGRNAGNLLLYYMHQPGNSGNEVIRE